MIILYGTTSDNYSVFAQINGIGTPGEQFARIEVEVGGKAKGLMDKFLLARIKINEERTVVSVGAWVVRDPEGM